jgi:MYXO-CTERM domain-containing protein
MNRVIAGLAVTVGGLLTLASTALANDNNDLPGEPSINRGKGYVIVPDPDPVEAVQHFSNILFLNRCASGCNIVYGTDNSSTNRSSIAQGSLTAFRYGDAKWNAVVDCVAEVFSRFNIVVTDDDPGAAEHMEAMVAGYGSQVGADPGVLGFAPFVCSYGYIPRSISYTFANDNYYGGGGGDVDEICATVAQEAAHTWGLDHEILNSDPMTYAPYSGRRQFADQLIQCGEYPGQTHTCGCSNTQQQQNSVQRIADRFGMGAPSPPEMTITEPEDGAQVDPGFVVRAEANESLQRAELYVDNILVATLTNGPYAFNAPEDLGEGGHRVEVRGYDVFGTPGTTFINVIIGEPCETPGDCQDLGDEYTCVGGRCVPGSGVPGGLGELCAGDEECFSGLCLSNGTEMRCVESCNLDGSDCPDGYDCLGFDGGGVCWPGDGGGGGGCSSSDGGGSALPIGVGLAFFGVVFGRRRRRR